jgi:DNA-binding MarR family transcriptional regulator
LSILPPNLVGLIKALEKRELIERRPHPQDGRALGLHTTAAGQQLMKQAEKQAAEMERLAAHRLAPQEQQQLIALLQKIYL